MGRDKAALRLDGASLIERAVAILSGVAGETLLACGDEERYAHLGRPLVLDSVPDGGPLAGLAAGIGRARTEWIAVLACDMPRADARVFELLLERAREHGHDACLLATEGGVEPLCSVYRRACLEPMRAALAAGERKVTAFARFAKADGGLPRVATLLESELPPELRSRGVAMNVNTPEDLEAEVSAGREASASAGRARERR